MSGEEINILGAGVSGLACAIFLKNKGFNVNVYEKRDTVGRRFNNDWQGIENWSEEIDVLEEFNSYGLNTSFEYEPLEEITVHAGTHSQNISDERPGAYLVRRGNSKNCFDVYLLEQCKKSGVNIHFNTSKKDVADIKIHVNATGPKKASGLVRGIQFNTEEPDSFHIAFNNHIARGFYSYLLIKNGLGTVATVFSRKHAQKSEAYLQNTISYFSGHLNPSEVTGGHHFTGFGHFELKRTLHDERRALLVGEAAGFQDYLWGFGMRYAIQSAKLASISIEKEIPYELLVKQHLRKKMIKSLINRKLCELSGIAGYYMIYLALTKSKHPLKTLRTLY